MTDELRTCLIVYNAFGSGQNATADEFEATNNDRSEVEYIRNVIKDLGYNVRVMGVRRFTAPTVQKIQDINPDFIFNLCEAFNEESIGESYIAGFFELLKVPYTGSPPLALALALNKKRTKQILRSAGIPVPYGIVVDLDETPNLEDLTPPYIVKPIREDGSAGITYKSVTSDSDEVIALVEKIHKEYEQAAIVEEYIEGRELTVPIIGDKHPRILAIGEMDFSSVPKKEPKIVTYQGKWDAHDPLDHHYPAELDSALQKRIERIALKAFKEIGARDYARVDIRLAENRRPYVIEVNTNPLISPEAGFATAAEISGMKYKDVIQEIIEETLKRAK
ncbi:MAG: D-alanine-D-alanine ligase-like protein [Parcubacteria group bacterium LiPW_41]|nr:MAG: D-alanine-D-alanine ligase-like protein [Parcubacteria group bacterium LiPW_41]